MRLTGLKKTKKIEAGAGVSCQIQMHQTTAGRRDLLVKLFALWAESSKDGYS